MSVPSHLGNIVRSSIKNNAEFEITGALCLLNGVYCQYIEGDVNVIQALYWKLVTDARHQDVKLLEFSGIAQRLFEGWAMACVSWNEQTHAAVEKLNLIDTLDLHAITAVNAVAMFQAIAGVPEGLQLAPLA